MIPIVYLSKEPLIKYGAWIVQWIFLFSKEEEGANIVVRSV